MDHPKVPLLVGALLLAVLGLVATRFAGAAPATTDPAMTRAWTNGVYLKMRELLSADSSGVSAPSDRQPPPGSGCREAD